MLGGYQILDLRNIDLSRATTESSITDVEVLKQLSQIADHIQKTYDFSKPLHNQLKPVLIRYRDKKVGEKHEVALYGNIEVINTYYKFRIVAKNEGEQLTINVEFEEKTDEYNNKYWSIKTAKILLTSEVAIFENITDKDGHKRFIEGEISNNVELPEGFTFEYGKWSLSGTHLLLVLSGKLLNTSTITAGIYAKTIGLPEWIYNKLIPTFQNTFEQKSLSYYGDDYTSQNASILIQRNTSDKQIQFYFSSITATQDRGWRIQFDLLIDNESQD